MSYKISDELYSEAFRFRLSKVWKEISEEQIISVKLNEGLTCYVQILGYSIKDTIGVVIYPGDENYIKYIESINHPPNRSIAG